MGNKVILWFLLVIGYSNAQIGPSNKNFKKHFYLDAECTSCIARSGIENHNVYTVSNAFYLDTLSEKCIETHRSTFKTKLLEEYKDVSPLIDNVVLRYFNSELELKRSMESNIKKYIDRGHTVKRVQLKLTSNLIEDRIEHYLQFIGTFGFSGSVLVAEKGKIVHQNSYGWALPQYQVLNTNETIYNIGSVAKSFTAQAILVLIAQGKLTLNTPINGIFEGVPKNKQYVTIHQLLTHTSGYKRDVLQLDASINSFEEARGKILSQPLTYFPGEKYNYSNAGFQLLGLIVEEITDMPLDTFLKKNVLVPNNIKDVHFFHDVPKRTLTAASMTAWGSKDFTTFSKRRYSNLASTGIIANTRGLYEWFTALRSNTKLYDQMSSSQSEGTVGYGFFTDQNGDMLTTTGDQGNYHSLLQYDKRKDRLIIVLSNISLYNFGVHRTIIAKAITEILDEGSKTSLKVVAPYNIKNLEGTYKNDTYELSIRVINNSPRLILSNQKTINHFFVTDATQRLAIKEKNELMQHVSNLIIDKKFNQLERIVGKFYGQVIKEDYHHYVREYGALKNIQVIGTIPLPWKSPNYETLLMLTYGTKIIDLRIVWNKATIYETLTETDHPKGAVLFLGRKHKNEWISHDFIKNVITELFFDSQFGLVFYTEEKGQKNILQKVNPGNSSK